MSSADVFNGVDLAIKNGFHVDLEGEKPDSLVSAAEKTLGLNFPPSYKSFLLSFGCGDVAGQEFYGVIKHDFLNSGVPDAIWLTLRERADSKLPFQFIIVGSQGNGAYYVIDCGRVSESHECPVVTWWPGLSGESYPDNAEIIAEDFGSFFLHMVEAANS